MDRLLPYLQDNAIAAALVSAGVLLLVLLLWPRRAAAPRVDPGPRFGAGAALAMALEGDLEGAESKLEELVRHGGPGRADAVLGLVAVLRARGDYDRAAQVIEAFARRERGPWLGPLRVRMALDAGHPDDAATLEGTGEVPVDLEIAARCRAGRWDEALRRYEERVPRKERDPAVLAGLLAGVAAVLARRGDARGARRAIKRAVGLDPEGLLPALVGAALHPKPTERRRLAELAARRVPWRAAAIRAAAGLDDGEPPDGEPDEAAALLRQARSLDAAGQRERALGVLRDHLERHPGDWRVRRQYCEWILESGEPADWRAELAEVLAHLPGEQEPRVGPPTCGRCGYRAGNPFYICPRCNALGSMLEGRDERAAGRAQPASEAGAGIDDVAAGLLLEPPRTLG